MKTGEPRLVTVVDRIEGENAVLVAEDGASITMPSRFLPAGAAEGCVVNISLSADGQSTADRRKKAGELLKKLKDRKGL